MIALTPAGWDLYVRAQREGREGGPIAWKPFAEEMIRELGLQHFNAGFRSCFECGVLSWTDDTRQSVHIADEDEYVRKLRAEGLDG